MPKNPARAARTLRGVAFVALAASTLLAGTAHAASTCLRAEGETPRVFEAVWKVPHERIAELREAYEKLKRVTGLNPRLSICGAEDVNALAIDSKVPEIQVFTGLLLTSQGADETAAVLAHEFAHLQLSHRAKKIEEVQEAINDGIRQATRDVARGADVGAAIQRAKVAIVENVTSYSRTVEREADDVGIKLAVKAGYAPGGARAFALRLLKAGLPEGTGYLSTHPGLGERAWYSGRLAANENFHAIATAQLTAGDVDGLKRTVAAWKAEAPDSGGAAYYSAFAALMTKRPPGEVSAELEDAVGYFDIDQQSVMGEEYSGESLDAAVALCVSLYREGKTVPALNCVKRLPPEGVKQFREVSDWNGFLVLGRGHYPGSSRVYWSQVSQGPIFISTCRHVATEAGLRQSRPWASVREPRLAANAPLPGPMMCDPTFCDCKPTSLERVVLPE